MNELCICIHHVIEHEASMLVFIFFVQLYKMVLFIERNCRKICIDGKIAEGGAPLFLFEQALNLSQQFRTNIMTTIVKGYGKATNFYCRITTELLAFRKTFFNFFPSAVGYIPATNLIIQKTKISNYTSIIFKNERIGYTQFLRPFCILKQELVQIFISAVKSGKIVILSKADEIHHLEADINQFVSLSQLFHKLPMCFSTLFRSPVFYHCSSPLEVEGIFALQNGGFSNRSCHINTPFF